MFRLSHNKTLSKPRDLSLFLLRFRRFHVYLPPPPPPVALCCNRCLPSVSESVFPPSSSPIRRRSKGFLSLSLPLWRRRGPKREGGEGLKVTTTNQERKERRRRKETHMRTISGGGARRQGHFTDGQCVCSERQTTLFIVA